MHRARRLTRVRGIEPVDIRQQHQKVGADHRRHTGGQPVIVAEADFGCRHRVVLVDNRHRAELEKRAHRGARVQVPAAGLGVLRRQQDLRHTDAMRRQRLAPGMRQRDLAGGGGGLFFLERQLAAVDAKLAPAERDRPARDDDDILAGLAQHGDIAGDTGKPGGVHRAMRILDQKR